MIHEKQSFTLVEILVVIVIIGILSSFIFFTVNDSVEKANLAKTKMFEEAIRNNLLMNLVSEWKLDGDANDSWGDNNGTMHNFSADPWKLESECISGQCLEFDGSNDYVNIPSSQDFNFNTGDFTWSVWIYPDDFDDYWHTFSINGDQDQGALKVSYNNKKIYFHSEDFSTWNKIETDPVKEKEWSYIILMRKNNTAFIYLNGKSYDGVSDFSNNFSSHALTLGNGHEGEFSDGLIDEVKIYNAAIPESQIKQEYLAGLNNLLASGNISQNEYNERIKELKLSDL